MDRCKNCLVAIVLALGLTGAQAQTAPHESLGPKGVLTAERQKVLAATMTTQGENFASFSDADAAALGLSKSENTNLRHLATKTEMPTGYHAYTKLSDGGILVAFVDEKTAYNYRFDEHLTLIAAIAAVKGTPAAIPLSEAQSPALAEIKYWADIADQLQELK